MKRLLITLPPIVFSTTLALVQVGCNSGVDVISKASASDGKLSSTLIDTALAATGKDLAPSLTPQTSTQTSQTEKIIEGLLTPDLPSKTFDQLKANFPKDCDFKKESREIACKNSPDITHISYAGGPDGILNVRLSKDFSCTRLHAIIQKRYGAGEDTKGGQISCGFRWVTKQLGTSIYHITITQRKNKNLTFQFGADQGP
jgi:hypothetical protein